MVGVACLVCWWVRGTAPSSKRRRGSRGLCAIGDARSGGRSEAAESWNVSAGPRRKRSFRGDRLYSAAMSLRIEGIEAWRWESRRCVFPVLRLRAIV